MGNTPLLRLLWRPIVFPGCSTAAFAAFVRYKRSRFPWLSSDGYVLAAVRPGSGVEFFDLPAMDELKLCLMKPFCKLNDLGMRYLPGLADAFYWPDSESLYHLYHGKDLLPGLPTRKYVPLLLDRFQRKGLPGWQIVSRGERSIIIAKDFMNNDGIITAVGVSANGVSIYRTSLVDGCKLCATERRHLMSSGCLSTDLLMAFLPESSTLEVCSVFRMLRWWLYQMIVDDESLPF